MLFRSRRQFGWWNKTGRLIWPRRGFSRPLSYLRYRVIRLPDTPHKIATGFAAGVAVSMTPFVGFHFILGAILAWLLRGNIIASAIGTIAGNPWTFPLIWLVTYEIGSTMLDIDGRPRSLKNLNWTQFITDPMSLFGPVLGPMLLGSLPLALLIGLLTYWGARRVVEFYRARREAQIRARQRREAADSA